MVKSPNTSNVADDATKCKGVPDLNPDNRWFSGPEFLRKLEVEWPGGQVDVVQTDVVDVELRCPFLHIDKFKSVFPFPDIHKFSSWTELVNVQTYLVRIVRNWLAIARKTPRKGGLITVQERKTAANLLFSYCQWENYRDEVTVLSQGGSVEKSSRIFKFSPYLDESNVLRMKGRIDAAVGVHPDVKRPILLPANHTVTRLIILSYHEDYHHLNHETVNHEN